MKRFAFDLALAGSMAALPALAGATPVETGRLALLGIVYAAVGLLGYARLLRRNDVRRALEAGIALFTLATAWFLSFAAWSHSTEIGLYLLFGTAILVIALRPGRAAAAGPRVDAEARRLRIEQQALMAVWQ